MKPDFPFRPASFPFFYGWVVLVASTVGVVMSVPGQTMGVSVFTDSLLEATGLTRLQVSNAYLAGTLASGLLLPLGGIWVDRFGVRPMVLVSCFGLSTTLLFLSVADRVAARIAESLPGLGPGVAAWSVLALAFATLRFSGQGLLTLVSRTMLGRWFERRRGLASALQSPVVNFAFAGAPLVLATWIDGVGWRDAWREMALLVGLGMGVVGWLFFRDTPEQCGLRMDGRLAPAPPDAGDAAEEPPPAREFTRGEALRTGAFWLVTLAIAIHAMVGTAITFHVVDIGAEAGLSVKGVVSIFLPIAVVSTFVGLAAGWAVDRLAVRWLVIAMMVGQLLMFAGMGSLASVGGRAVVIVGWGISAGFYAPLTIAALPGFFGRTHLGAIQGAMMMCLVIASAVGPSVFAAFREFVGSYGPAFLASCALPAAVLVAAPFTRDPQREPGTPGR